MKKLLFIPLTIFLSSCSRQQKAERLVKHFLDSTLNDPHSYESVSFTTLKPFYATYALGDPEGKRLDTLAANCIDSISKYKPLDDSVIVISDGLKAPKSNKKLAIYYQHMQDSIESIITERDKTYKGRILNYSITHTYRAKNGFGALGIHTTDFQIDSTLTKVLLADENSN